MIAKRMMWNCLSSSPHATVQQRYHQQSNESKNQGGTQKSKKPAGKREHVVTSERAITTVSPNVNRHPLPFVCTARKLIGERLSELKFRRETEVSRQNTNWERKEGGNKTNAFRAGLDEKDAEEDDLMWVRINGVLKVPVIPDCGSDLTMVPSSVVTELRELQPNLLLESLPQLITATSADGSTVYCNECLRLDLQILTVAADVNVRKEQCLVMPTNIEKVLSGNSTLQSWN